MVNNRIPWNIFRDEGVLPCPKCNGTKTFIRYYYGRGTWREPTPVPFGHRVVCGACNFEAPESRWKKTPEEAIVVWNRYKRKPNFTLASEKAE